MEYKDSIGISMSEVSTLEEPVIKEPDFMAGSDKNSIDCSTDLFQSLTVEESCQEMMRKVGAYLHGELAATCEDYKLLETLNNLSVNKYREMSEMVRTLTVNMQSVNEKYKSLEPFLQQIDALEDSAIKLEQAAYKLDAYSKQLESKFKKLERR